MEDDKSLDIEESMISEDEDNMIIRKKVKNKRKNYTINEIKIVLDYYKKNGNIRATAKFFDIPKSTVSGWVQREDEYLSSTGKNNKCRLNPGGRKPDSVDYEEIINEFIKEVRSNDIAITASEVIAKAIELMPEFKNKSYNALHLWFKRFRIRHSYSIRKITKIAQSMPIYFLEDLRNYLYQAIKDNIEFNLEQNASLIGNVDETPLSLEPITNTTLEKIGEKTIKIRSFGKMKQRISCILCVLSNGKRLPPMLVFKGVPDGTLEKRLNKLPEVKNNRIYIACQKNSWVDASTFINWLNRIWFRSYSFKPNEGTILYYDKAPSHLTDDVINMFAKNNCYYRLIPPGLTSYCQPLDLCINKPFKDLLKLKYREFCIYNKNTIKPTPEDMVSWVSSIWYSDKISEETIMYSFKKGGITLKNDASEDIIFQWPKTPDMILIEDIPQIKNENNFNGLNLNNEEYEYDSEEDILFDYERYSISSIRKEVIKGIKNNNIYEDIEIDDEEINSKNYDFYLAFGYFK